MAKNSQFDNLRLDNLNLPYDLSKSELSTDPRLVEGSKNTYCTMDGALTNRPGLLSLTNPSIGGSIANMVYYETLKPNNSTGKIAQYIIASYYKTSTAKYEIAVFNRGIVSGDPLFVYNGLITGSVRPHEIVVIRGKAYIKSFPSSGTDKLGMYTLEVLPDETIEVNNWGLLGPTIPARLASTGMGYIFGSALVTRGINSTDTSVIIHQGGVLAGQQIISLTPPYNAYIDQEKVTVTAKTINTPFGYDTLTITRGVDGTTATNHPYYSLIWATPAWNTADYAIDVTLGWKYSYCWKNKNGQYSNRAKLETNLSQVPSVTPPLDGLIPKITVTCPSDTTQYPKILILRSTDGGGTFFPLTEIDNPGTATVDFEDKYLPTGATAATNGITYDGPIYSTVAGVTFNTPVPDTFLSGGYSGPGLLTNSPLPTVTPPKIVGTDYPEKSTSLVYWKNRIWVAINNILYFTSNEELAYGIPEESCDTSNEGGFFRFQDNITQIFAFNDSLLIFTRSGRVLRMLGNTKDTFTPEAWLENVGFAADQPRAIVKNGEKLYFLSNNYHVIMLDTNSNRIISHPLGKSISTAIKAGLKVFLTVYKGDMKEWLCLGLLENPESSDEIKNTLRSKLYIYDLLKSHQLTRNYSDNIPRETIELPEKTFDFWNSPWDIGSVTAMLACPYESFNDTPQYMLMLDTSVVDTFSKVEDYGSATFDFVAITGMMENPVGNHVNSNRLAAVHPSLWGIRLERVQYDGDIDPDIKVFKDDLWLNSTPLKESDLQYIRPSRGYKTVVGTLNEVGKYFAVRLEVPQPRRPVNLQKLTLTFEPEAGP